MPFLNFRKQSHLILVAASFFTIDSATFGQGQPSGKVLVSDAVADFSISKGNPNGKWSYGYTDTLGSDLKRFLVPESTGVKGFAHWGAAPGWPRTAGSNPSIDKNVTGANISPLPGLVVPPNVLHMHPGSNGQYSVLRWTATAPGAYVITGYFEGLDSHPATTDVHILLNKEDALFGDEIASFMNPSRFNITQVLKTGDTIDFAVGFGSNGNYLFDSTGLSVRVSLKGE